MLGRWLALKKNKKNKKKCFCSNCFRLVHCVPHHWQGSYRISSAQSVPSSASRWCKPPLRPFACQWRPFVLIQDCTILKKSTWWRQCDTTDNINGQQTQDRGDTAFPHSNRENNGNNRFVWLLRDVLGVKATCLGRLTGSPIEIKPDCSFSRSYGRHVA